MNSKFEFTIKYLITAAVVVVILLIGLIAYFDMLAFENNNEFNKEIDFIDRAQIQYADGSSSRAALPIALNRDEDITVTYNLSEISNLKNKSVALFVFYKDITCYVDDVEIYRYSSDKNHTIISGGYSVHVFDLPETIHDKKLVVRYQNNLLLSKIFKLKKIDVGDRHAIFMYHLIKYDLVDYLIIMFLLAIFVVTTALTTFYSNEHYFRAELTGLGLMCLAISLYLLPQLWTYNYIMYDYRIFTYVTEYYMLMLFFPIIFYILRENLDPKFDRFFDMGIVISTLNASIQTIMVLLTDYEFIDVGLFSLLIVSSNLILIAVAFIMTDTQKYPQKKGLLISMLPPLVTYTMALVIYLATRLVMYINFILVGILFFVLIQIYNLFRSFTILKRENIKSQVYKELAYVDLMTGLKNRLSYAEYLADDTNQKRNQHIIVIDIDGLKDVNDQYGHSAGDKLIIKFSTIIKKIIEKYKKIDAFRIGGDEFIFFVDTTTGKSGQQIVAEINEMCNNTVTTGTVRLTFSAGIIHYDPVQAKSLKGSVSEADLIMYQNKKTSKGRSAYEN